MPGTATTASGIVRQPFRDPQCDQFRATTPRCFPLPPEGGPESQPDPAGESNQHFGRFAKAEIAAPAAHTRIYAKVDLAGLREVATFDLGELS